MVSDSCGDSDPGFDARMAELASSVWQTSDKKGPVAYQAADVESEAECAIDRAYIVQLYPKGDSYAGQIAAVAVERCSQMDCQIIYAVSGP
jgi:hypothetical protein